MEVRRRKWRNFWGNWEVEWKLSIEIWFLTICQPAKLSISQGCHWHCQLRIENQWRNWGLESQRGTKVLYFTRVPRAHNLDVDGSNLSVARFFHFPSLPSLIHISLAHFWWSFDGFIQSFVPIWIALSFHSSRSLLCDWRTMKEGSNPVRPSIRPAPCHPSCFLTFYGRWCPIRPPTLLVHLHCLAIIGLDPRLWGADRRNEKRTVADLWNQ
jgi:hypothetical protein